MIHLPHHEGFWEFLHSQKPPGWGNNLSTDRIYFAPDSNGILQLIQEEKLEDYWEENLNADCFWEEEDLEDEESILWLPF